MRCLWSSALGVSMLGGITFLAVGCASVRTDEEVRATQRLTDVSAIYRPQNAKPALPVLTADSEPADYVRFGLLNHPGVEAAYLDWRAAVASVAPARALPDPKLTFQADITDTVMSLMPGLMFDIMAPGKRAAMGREASLAAETAYRAFAAKEVATATELRKAWVELTYVDEAIAVRHEMARVLEQSLAAAQADYATGRGMGTLEEQTKVLNTSAKLQSDLAVFSDRQLAARARFKAALGLGLADPDPVWPRKPWPAAALPDEQTLWTRMLEANPSLGGMHAMIEMAVSQVQVAKAGNLPDFSVGLMVDTKADPLMYRPTATVSLPVWRGKIKAAIDAAQAREGAARARLSAEQIGMAAELAQMLFMVREADRMLAYLDHAALPNVQRALRSAEGAYSTGMGAFGPLAELRLMELGMRLEIVDVKREREVALADLASLVASDPSVDMRLTAVNDR